MEVSAWLMPGCILIILGYGLAKRLPVYDAFVDGAKQGIASAGAILPFLVAMLPVLALLNASGVLSAFVRFVSPGLTWLGIPMEALPVMLMRPLSGSGAMAMLERTLSDVGPDSYPGRVASALMGSSETIFYTVALYMGAAGVRRTRYAVPAALLAWLVGGIAAAWACTVM